jgi:hypothetical protein
MDTKGMEWDGVDCVDLNQSWVNRHALVNADVDVWIYKTPRNS